MANSARWDQYGAVLDAESLRAELTRQLDEGIVRAADVADALKIGRARITEMRLGKRRVQQHEMRPLADLLGLGERSAPTILLPVALPSEDALTTMIQGLLIAVGAHSVADEHARTLAQRLPAALAGVSGALTPVPSGAANSRDEPARLLATHDRD